LGFDRGCEVGGLGGGCGERGGCEEEGVGSHCFFDGVRGGGGWWCWC
jgi:hypothetical protein